LLLVLALLGLPQSQLAGGRGLCAVSWRHPPKQREDLITPLAPLKVVLSRHARHFCSGQEFKNRFACVSSAFDHNRSARREEHLDNFDVREDACC